MVKFPISPCLLLCRRWYAVEAAPENVKRVVQPANTVVRKEADSFSAEKKEKFWMRDPNTGNWIPEDHFGQVDAADLRNKFLPNKHSNLTEKNGVDHMYF